MIEGWVTAQEANIYFITDRKKTRSSQNPVGWALYVAVSVIEIKKTQRTGTSSQNIGDTF